MGLAFYAESPEQGQVSREMASSDFALVVFSHCCGGGGSKMCVRAGAGDRQGLCHNQSVWGLRLVPGDSGVLELRHQRILHILKGCAPTGPAVGTNPLGLMVLCTCDCIASPPSSLPPQSQPLIHQGLHSCSFQWSLARAASRGELTTAASGMSQQQPR